MVSFPEFNVGVCACWTLQQACRRAQQFPFSDCITRSDEGPIPAAIEAVGLVGFDSLAVRQTFERKPRSHRFRQWLLRTSSERAGARLGLDAARVMDWWCRHVLGSRLGGLGLRLLSPR